MSSPSYLNQVRVINGKKTFYLITGHSERKSYWDLSTEILYINYVKLGDTSNKKDYEFNGTPFILGEFQTRTKKLFYHQKSVKI